MAHWAVDSKELPPPVRDLYDAWYNFRFVEIESAIEAMSANDDSAYKMGEGGAPRHTGTGELSTRN